jgi:BASS family bile acid:Na+ symporter
VQGTLYLFYIMHELIVPISIGIIMLGIGLGIRLSDFARVIRQPRAILTGLTLQIIGLPLIGFLIAFIWPIDPIFKVGIVLIASCPGGTGSNLVTHMLKGKTALSVSLTSINSFIILLTIPVYMDLALSHFLSQKQTISLPFMVTFQEIGFSVILPVMLGILIRKHAPKTVRSIKKFVNYLLPAILLFVFFYVAISNTRRGEALEVLPYFLYWPLLLLNLVTIFLGYYVSKFLKISHDASYTIGVELGLQNSALAIFIAHHLLDNYEMSYIAIVYSSFSFFTTLGIAYVMKHRLKPATST